MGTIAIGDIHGNLPALRDLLDQLSRREFEKDTVVFLGDYIDRGRDSRSCVDTILSFRREYHGHVVCLLGNHEDWLLRTVSDYSRHSWLLGMEAFDTIRSYSKVAVQVLSEAVSEAGPSLFLGRCRFPYDIFFDAMPAAHRTFFEELALYFESADCICTHAGLNPYVERTADQSRETLVWGDAAFPAAYSGHMPVVYGHYNNGNLDPAGWPSPRTVGNTIGIDTIAHGVLTAIRMPERRVIQSRRYLLPSDA